jgi:hypothetical protein
MSVIDSGLKVFKVRFCLVTGNRASLWIRVTLSLLNISYELNGKDCSSSLYVVAPVQMPLTCKDVSYFMLIASKN